MMGTGSMQGAISGSTMTFHMTVPNGGFNGMMSSCSMGIEWQYLDGRHERVDQPVKPA
jgi:hypothetical protein